jgi:hypothetical protein
MVVRPSDRVVTRLRLDRDPSQFSECVDSGRATEPPVTGGFHTPKWHLSFIVYGRAIDVADTRLDLGLLSIHTRHPR